LARAQRVTTVGDMVERLGLAEKAVFK